MSNPAGPLNSGPRIALAIGVVCIAAASGFFVARLAHVQPTQGLVDNSRVPPGGTPQSEAQAPPGENHPSASHPIPVEIPDISLAGIDDGKHALSEWKGHPLMINFWATWCAPCRREIPLLKRLRHERAGEGMEVIGIAVDFRDAVQHYAQEMGIDYPVLVGEQDGLDAIAAFGMDTVFPFTVFADSRGRIVTLKIGELHADEARLILDRVEDIDRGRIDLATAKQNISEGVAALAVRRAAAEEDDIEKAQTKASPAPQTR
jgi:thiol-disulfide isomerase/thioredoxin